MLEALVSVSRSVIAERELHGDALRLDLCELPKRADTLLLRCLGAGSTSRAALRELRANGTDLPVGRTLVPLVVKSHLERRNGPQPEDEEFVVETQDIYGAWRQRIESESREAGHSAGLAEGQVWALLAVLDARGIEVDAERAALIRSCRDLAQLETWLRRAASAERLEDVLGSDVK